MKLRGLFSKRFVSPLWVHHPAHIQIDVSNHCNLSCTYCNVKQDGAFDLPQGEMNDETFSYVLNKIKKEVPGIVGIHPFGNGEPLLDKYLLWRATKIKKVCGVGCHIVTNGTVFKNRELLIHPNMIKVRFTISANTSETYARVHGKPLLGEALRTFYYFNDNKFDSQEVAVHYIVTKDNYHEVTDWIKRFKGYRRRIFSVHTHPLQLDSEKTKLNLDMGNLFFDSTGKQYSDISPDNVRLPCQCWDLLAISPFGDIMHCIDFPYSFNYGSVYDVSLLDAWKTRLNTRMETEPCKGCSLRRSSYKKILDRWYKK